MSTFYFGGLLRVKNAPRTPKSIRAPEKILHSKRFLGKRRSRLIGQAVAITTADNKALLRRVFNIRKSYTYDTVIILHFYKKRKKNPEYYPGIFSYYICSSFSSICKPPFKTMIIVLSFISRIYLMRLCPLQQLCALR